MNARDSARPGGHGRGAGKKPGAGGHGRKPRGGKGGGGRRTGCFNTLIYAGLLAAAVWVMAR